MKDYAQTKIFNSIMSKFKTKILSEEIERVNPETGEVEIITSRKEFVQKIEPEEFVTVYLPTALQVIMNLSPLAAKLLSWFLYNVDFNNRVPNIVDTRLRCMEEMKIKQASYYLGLKEILSSTYLDDKGKEQHCIIQENGWFVLHPDLVWKGTKSSREKAKMQVEFRFSLG